ncbi:MAG: hypothetical protein LC749_02170, partial [Actinobacteria bacterium]|nr:hypothetical protein [Actinomycetota bacterium]
MAFDAASGKVVMFGGYYHPPLPAYRNAPDVYFDDTWTWDGVTWTQVHPPKSPPARFNAAMAPDPLGKLVLFGGMVTGFGQVGDTWTWEGRAMTWRQETPATSPNPRDSALIAYDEARGRAVMIGWGNWYKAPNPESRVDYDTWTWDGNNWHRELQTIDHTMYSYPGGIMAYSSSTREVVLYNGKSNTAGTNSPTTFTWNGAKWSVRNPQQSPPVADTDVGAYYPPQGKIVVFIGSSTSSGTPAGDQAGGMHDTWTWDGKELNGGVNTSVTTQLILDPDNIPADGTSTSNALVVLKVAGKGLSGQQVQFTTDGDVTFGPVTDHGDGTYTATITSSTTADKEHIESSVTVAGHGTGAEEAYLNEYVAPRAKGDCVYPSTNAPPAWTDLDTTFGCGGTVTTSRANDMYGDPMVVQPDGRIVAGSYNRLLRYMPDGSLDPSFGNHGTAALVGSPASHAVAIQPDGKILLADQQPGDGPLASIRRYTADGRLDGGFGAGGRIETPYLADPHGLLVQPDGKMVLSGGKSTTLATTVDPSAGGATNHYVARFNPDGSPDPGFGGSNGTATIPFTGIFIGSGVALQPADGKILLGGGVVTSSTTVDMVVARLTPTGARDSSFNPCPALGKTNTCDGIVITRFTSGTLTPNNSGVGAVLVQPDGRIIAGGAVAPGSTIGVTNNNPGGRWGLALARYNSDGSLDPTFNPCTLGAQPCGGEVITDHMQGYHGSGGIGGPPDGGGIYDLALQPDGRIVATGYGGPHSRPEFLVARYNPDGVLDSCGTPGYTFIEPWASTGPPAKTYIAR